MLHWIDAWKEGNEHVIVKISGERDNEIRREREECTYRWYNEGNGIEDT